MRRRNGPKRRRHAEGRLARLLHRSLSKRGAHHQWQRYQERPSLGSTCKSNFQCPPASPGEGVCDRCAVHRDTQRNSADIRLHVRLLHHPPRMTSTIGRTDYSDQIMRSIYGPNYANLPYSQNSSGLPSSTQRTKPTSGSLNWSRHLFYQPYIRRYPKALQRCSNRQIPFPHITTRL